MLGCRLKEWGADQHFFSEARLDEVALVIGAMRPNWRRYDTYAELKAEVSKVKHEGFVIWDDAGNEIKIKSPYYLATKFLGRKTEKRLNEILDDPREAKKILDEEFYVVLDYVAENKDKFIAMTEQERYEFLREFFDKEIME